MFDSVIHLIEESGAWMYILAPLFTVTVAILPIPAELPAMVNGMIFGPLVGALMTWSAALVGALVSFELARRFGRPLAEKALSPVALARADGAMISAGWPGFLTVRFIPTVAFTLINWTAGLTSIRRATFVWTTAIGIVPGVIAFTLSGAGLGTLYHRYQQLPFGVGLLGIFLMAWMVFRFRERTGLGLGRLRNESLRVEGRSPRRSRCELIRRDTDARTATF